MNKILILLNLLCLQVVTTRHLNTNIIEELLENLDEFDDMNIRTDKYFDNSNKNIVAIPVYCKDICHNLCSTDGTCKWVCFKDAKICTPV